MIRVRSHNYLVSNNKYIDTTYYDNDLQSFDLGYQLLKKINVYPEFSYLKKLFIDHNELTYLPEPIFLPNIEYLNCSNNKLENIPYYDKLVFLDISFNKIKSCKKYNNSNLEYYDCGHNNNLKMDFNLQLCKQLYINDNMINELNLRYVPKLEILDCENNIISELIVMDHCLLKELKICNNKIKKLPLINSLITLIADNNNIDILDTYPKIETLNIAYNKLKYIPDQPLMKRIYANNNEINDIGLFPKIEIMDLSNNLIEKIKISDFVKTISLQFNPIKILSLSEDNFINLKEIQTSYNSYKKLYEKYQDKIKYIDIHVNENMLTKTLDKIESMGLCNKEIVNFFKKQIPKIIFCDRDTYFYYISHLIYKKFQIKKINGSEEKMSELISKIYYKNIVASVYFDDYID